MQAIAFVPEEDIVAMWSNIIEPETYKLQDDMNEEMDAFIDYFQNTYIGKMLRNGRRGRPTFEPSLWGKYNSVINEVPTTNNAVEAWNGVWNRSQRNAHQFTEIVAGLRREDAEASGKWLDQLNFPPPDAAQPSGCWRREEARCKASVMKAHCLQYHTYEDKRLYLDHTVILMGL